MLFGARRCVVGAAAALPAQSLQAEREVWRVMRVSNTALEVVWRGGNVCVMREHDRRFGGAGGGGERGVGGDGAGVIVRAERAAERASDSWGVMMHEVAGLVDGCARWVRLASEELGRGALSAEEASRVAAMLESATRGLSRLMDVAGRGGARASRAVRESGRPGSLGLYGSEGLHRVMGAVEEHLTPMARERGVRLECAVSVGVLEAGPLPLYGVVANGVRNAIEASAEGGVVTVGAWVEGDRVVLEVRDEGGAPSEAALSRAFCAGWSGKEGGAGVGLAMSREVVEGLGGGIWLLRDAARSETVLRVEIPCRAGHREDVGGRMIG